MFNPVEIYDVHTKARERIFGWLRPLSLEQYTQTFPFGLATLRRTLTHIASAEWFLSRWLHGEVLPPTSDWPLIEPRMQTFAELEAAWRAQAPETRARLGSVADWQTVVVADLVQPDRSSI